MLDLYSAEIENISVHKVGNKCQNEGLLLTESPLSLSFEELQILKSYFLKPFREKEEHYLKFIPENAQSRLQDFVEDHFKGKDFHKTTKDISLYLFDKSDHSHIKSGEVFIVSFSGIIVDGKQVDAIGIFKNEIKHHFIQYNENEKQLAIEIKEGTYINKLDKGCLIFNLNAEDGYKILSIDNNKYDTKYWLERFLDVEPMAEKYFFTKNYLKLCKNFAKEVVLPAQDKQQEIMFMNKAVNHFSKKEEFDETHFLNETLEEPLMAQKFVAFKEEKGPKYGVEDITSFPIDNTAVKNVKKTVKSTIELDTHVQLKFDFISPEIAEKYVEKGWDEERQMYYYLVYFNHEEKSG